MTWLAPVAFIGLVAVALPILIHLFARNQPPTVKFPTLRFVPDTIVTPTRRTRISDPLLLAIRVAIIALAVAALARPVSHASARTQHDSRVAAAIVVDTSISMRRHSTRNTTAVANAIAYADSLARIVRLHRIIMTTAPSAALRSAAAWADAQQATPQITVISDFQNGTLDSADIADMPPHIAIHLVPIAVVDSAVVTPQITAADTAKSVRLIARDADTQLAHATLEAAYAAGAAHVATALTIVFANAAEAQTTRRLRTPASSRLLDIATRMREDTTLRAAAATASTNAADGMRDTATDTTLATHAIIVARNERGAPLAALSADSANNPVVISFAEPGTLSAAAVVAAALDATRDRNAMELNPDVVSPAALERWQKRTPAKPPRSTSSESDGRWLWLLALALIGIETFLRRPRLTVDA